MVPFGKCTFWATCALVENGFVRIASSPKYVTLNAKPEQVAKMLRVFCQSPNHVFWNEDLSILDPTTYNLTHVTGHRQNTDVYLAALARRCGGKLATFDQMIPVHALVGDASGVIEVIVGE